MACLPCRSLQEFSLGRQSLDRPVSFPGVQFSRALYHLANSYMDLKMYVQALPHLKQSLALLESIDSAGMRWRAMRATPQPLFVDVPGCSPCP